MRLVGLVSVTNKALQVSPRLVRHFLNHTLHSVVKYTSLCLEPLPFTTIEQFSQLRSSMFILSPPRLDSQYNREAQAALFLLMIGTRS